MTQQNDKKLELHLKHDNLKATCDFDTKKTYTLLTGSQIAFEIDSRVIESIQTERKELIASGGLIADAQKKYYTLQRDWPIITPSRAACFVVGKKCNGFKEWRDNQGVSLDALCKDLGIKRFKRNGHN